MNKNRFVTLEKPAFFLFLTSAIIVKRRLKGFFIKIFRKRNQPNPLKVHSGSSGDPPKKREKIFVDRLMGKT